MGGKEVSELVQHDDKGRNAHARAEILDENALLQLAELVATCAPRLDGVDM